MTDEQATAPTWQEAKKHGSPDTQDRAVPLAATRFSIGEFTFGDNGENAKTAPVRMVARSGKPIEHWYWGRIVHDLSGMQLHKARLPVDYCHDYDEVIGYLNRFGQESGEDGIPSLVCSGALVPYKDNDRASEIVFKAKNGVPWEASIDWGGDGIVIEEVSGNATVEVNGYTLQGPAVVVRQWPLRGVAVCPYGMDMNTSSEFAAGDKNRTVSVTVASGKGTQMSQDAESRTDVEAEDQTDSPSAQAGAAEAAEQVSAVDADKAGSPEAPEAPEAVEGPDKPAGEAAEPQEGVDAETAETPDEPAEIAEGTPQQECQRFIEAFGDQGGRWFAEGKTFSEAQQLHVASLQEQVTSLKDENAKLRAAFGEDVPLEFQADGAPPASEGKKPDRLEQSLGPNLARVARGMKLQGGEDN